MLKYLLHFFMLYKIIKITDGVNYCNIKCKSDSIGEHTMCKFPGINFNECHDYIITRDRLNRKMKINILNSHNKLRSRVALGKLYSKPGASNMLQLVWDNELARIAQRAADQCNFKHDDCRWVERFTVGQNIAIFQHSKTYTENYLNGVQGWFDEYKDYPDTNKYQNVEDKKVGHYTQLIWAESRYLGCARSRYTKDNFYVELIFCNYGPAGNFQDEDIYKLGIAGSQCPFGFSRSSIYKGLCHKMGDGDVPGDTDNANNFIVIKHFILLLLSVLIHIVF